jgi:hypothetical protein
MNADSNLETNWNEVAVTYFTVLPLNCAGRKHGPERNSNRPSPKFILGNKDKRSISLIKVLI